MREQSSEPGGDLQARWSLVERVAAGVALQRAARLRALLIHVGRHSVFEPGNSLREMEIGTVVFGRPSKYDTSQDNIVRVNFSELRKRIQQHFAAEGQAEPLQFDIPRGSYELRFFLKRADAFDQVYTQLLPEEATPTVAPAAEIVPEEIARQSPATPVHVGVRRWLLTCYALLAVTGCALVVAFWFHHQARIAERQLAGWSVGPAMRNFWQPFLGGPEPVDIVLADSSLALAQDITGHDLSLSDYISYNYQPLFDAEVAHHQQPGTAKLLLARNTGSAGDFKVAALIQALGPATLSRITVARAYSAAAVRDHNSVLLGSRRSNPWVELLEASLQYRFDTSPDRHETVITVLHPRKGEQSRYVSVSDPSTRVSYAVIAVLPSPGGSAHALLIAGTDSRATLAAGEFLTSEKQLESLSTLLNGAGMDHVQILIRAETMRDTPINSKIISVRTEF